MESQIKTVEDAFNYLGADMAVLQSFNQLPETDRKYMEACYQRMMVTRALNKEANGGVEWQPNYGDGNRKYESWVWLKKNPDPAGVGFVVGVTYYVSAYTVTGVGSRLCFKSEELVMYFNRQFITLLEATMAQ